MSRQSKRRRRRFKHERHSNRCSETGKIRHPNEAAAQAEIRFAEVAYVADKTPVRAYRCGYCGEWHITSRR